MSYNDKYLVIVENNNEKVFEFTKESFSEIEARLESVDDSFTKASIYLNSNPNTFLGHYIKANNRLLYNDYGDSIS